MQGHTSQHSYAGVPSPEHSTSQSVVLSMQGLLVSFPISYPIRKIAPMISIIIIVLSILSFKSTLSNRLRITFVFDYKSYIAISVFGE
jgi:hypothetical protein